MEPNKRQIEVPVWTIDAVKILGSVVISLALAWVKFTSLEKEVGDHKIAISEVRNDAKTLRDTDVAHGQRLGTLEVQQTLVSGEFRESLKRIEDEIKEIKADFKTTKNGHTVGL